MAWGVARAEVGRLQSPPQAAAAAVGRSPFVGSSLCFLFVSLLTDVKTLSSRHQQFRLFVLVSHCISPWICLFVELAEFYFNFVNSNLIKPNFNHKKQLNKRATRCILLCSQ